MPSRVGAEVILKVEVAGDDGAVVAESEIQARNEHEARRDGSHGQVAPDHELVGIDAEAHARTYGRNDGCLCERGEWQSRERDCREKAADYGSGHRTSASDGGRRSAAARIASSSS